MTRAEILKSMVPHVIADVTMYPTAEGGRVSAAHPGWGCPCCVSRDPPIVGYDGWPLLGETTLGPGDQRRLGFWFASGEEAAEIMRAAGRFYLWEGKFIGEAVIVMTAKAY